MNIVLPAWVRSLLPARASVSHAERLRSGVGALIGILVTGLLSAMVAHSSGTALWLIAPMGASAVLLFGVPASPLAQPWSILGGNVVAALIGVTCAKLIDEPLPAAAIAIFLTIGAMFALHCLHPPSGAVALTAVLGGPEIHASGFGFVLVPVALNSLLLIAVALTYNKATGRRYPHTQQIELAHPHGTVDPLPPARLGFTPADLQSALKDYDQVLDVSPDDLEALFRHTQAHAFRRHFGEAQCSDFMSRDVISVEFGTELSEAWGLMQAHTVHALPVLNGARRVIGIVTRTDFLRHADPLDHASLKGALRAFLERTTRSHSDKHEVVGQIMSAPAKTVSHDAPLVKLVSLMSAIGFHHLPVVDADQRLVGMVTQTDLVAALYTAGLPQNAASTVSEASI
jgi:CBS domain-containing membrane protein